MSSLKLIGWLLRCYSYAYHAILCLFLLALGVVASIGGQHNLNLPMLPWKGVDLTHWLLMLSVTGLVAIVLAVTGWFRFAFPLWCLAVAYFMVRGFFLSQYAYSGPSHFRSVVLLVVGAVGAFLASLQLFKSKASSRR